MVCSEFKFNITLFTVCCSDTAGYKCVENGLLSQEPEYMGHMCWFRKRYAVHNDSLIVNIQNLLVLEST